MAQENTHYEAVIADLEAKRDQLNAMIETLKQMKGVPLASLGSAPTSNPAGGSTEISHDAFFGMTIPEAAKKYLDIVKQTKKHPELCDALLNGGFKTSAANFREVVRSTLGRHPDFVKISGQWGLKDWYGNRSTRKTRRASAADPASGTPSDNVPDDQGAEVGSDSQGG